MPNSSLNLETSCNHSYRRLIAKAYLPKPIPIATQFLNARVNEYLHLVNPSTENSQKASLRLDFSLAMAFNFVTGGVSRPLPKLIAFLPRPVQYWTGQFRTHKDGARARPTEPLPRLPTHAMRLRRSGP